MKIIIGLGNPGEKYRNSRHNVGYMVIDEIKNRKLKTKNTVFTKTNTFMNDSGGFVKHLISQYPNIPISDVYIIHDDLDLPLGTWKIQYAKGPKDNGGINSIEQVLGTDNFWRIRIGIDNRKPEERIPGEEYVLEDFTKEERKTIDRVIDEICKKLATF